MVAVPLAAVPAADVQPMRAVRIWLVALILLVFAMVLVGGATRLTESGLSITEWNLVTGTLPPLSEAAWAQAFELYRQSPQYELLNRGMSLGEFRTIYWWEWAHRELGRFIGLVYIAGFLWFALRGGGAGANARLARRDRRAARRAGAGRMDHGRLGAGARHDGGGADQARAAPDARLPVLRRARRPVRAARRRAGRGGAGSARGWRPSALVVLAFVQIALGGLVAGHDAGLTYNTWPLMDGRFVPTGLARLEPAWLNLVDNIVAIQFNHRIGGYVLAAALLAYALATRRAAPPVRARALLLAALVLAQVAVGIATLVHVVPIGLALAHQGLALILLLTLVWNASVLRARATPGG